MANSIDFEGGLRQKSSYLYAKLSLLRKGGENMAKLGSCCGSKTSVHDSVCQDLTLTDETAVTVWENSTPFAINGTILVENASSSTGDVTLTVTSSPATPAIPPITPGNSISITANNIADIQLAGTAASVANVKISYSLNYNF